MDAMLILLMDKFKIRQQPRSASPTEDPGWRGLKRLHRPQDAGHRPTEEHVDQGTGQLNQTQEPQQVGRPDGKFAYVLGNYLAAALLEQSTVEIFQPLPSGFDWHVCVDCIILEEAWNVTRRVAAGPWHLKVWLASSQH